MQLTSVADDKQVEVRLLVPADQVAVLDALAVATGSDRTSVVRQMIREVVERELHRAITVLRVARINPLASEEQRKHGG